MHRLALGTAQFGMDYGIGNRSGMIARADGERIIGFARDVGIRTIDTAIGYGESETRLGQFGLDGFDVVTKIPPIPPKIDDPAVWVQRQIAGSLHRLGVDAVYGLLLHRPADLMGPWGAEIYRALCDAQHNALTRRIGISIYSPDILDQLPDRFRFDLVQAPFNLVDRQILESGWLHKLKASGAEVHARSVFLQGLLLMKRSDIPDGFNRWKCLWDRWHSWLQTSGVSPIQACLAYSLSLPELDRVVVGVDSLDQIEKITQCARNAATHEFPDIGSGDVNLTDPSKWHADG